MKTALEWLKALDSETYASPAQIKVIDAIFQAGATAQREAIATRLRKSSNWWGACVEECALVTLPKGET